MRQAHILVLLSLGYLAASATAQDYEIITSGPHHVVQGHNLFFSVNAIVTSGVINEDVTPSVVGLPAGTTAKFVNMIRYCCTTVIGIHENNPLELLTSPSTPTGVYPLTLIYVTKISGLKRSTTYMLYVDPVPVVIPVHHLRQADAPASLDQYNANMLSHGRQHCTTAELAIWEGFVWYYDGERVYYQIADATKDPSWNYCAQLVGHFYRSYVLDNNASIPGHRDFPHGQAMDYERFSDPLSLQAVRELAAINTGFNVAYMIDWSGSREKAYGLECELQAQKLGISLRDQTTYDLVDFILGDFDQWFISNSASYVQPFMVALSAEALIEYWETSDDPRIPPILQLAADQLWKRSWNISCNCFNYYFVDGTIDISRDLNLLIAPLYGWVFQQTGDEGYRTMGDEIFDSGVAGAWLDGGKQFSQNYRWSGKYLDWRETKAIKKPVK